MLGTFTPWLQARNISIILKTFTFPQGSSQVTINSFVSLMYNALWNITTPDMIVLAASSATDFFACVPAFNQLQLTPKIALYTTTYADVPYSTFEYEAEGWLTTR